MLSAIDKNGRVCVCAALLYRTAIVRAQLAESLPKEPRFQGIEAGQVVAVQYAGRTPNGEPLFYFGRQAGAWLGLAPEHGLERFVM
jgi:hypothetical protein